MNDYARTSDLVNEATLSGGSAQKQYNLYIDSLEGSQQRLNKQIEDFYQTTLQGNGVLKTLNDLLGNTLKFINKIGTAPTLLVAVSSFKAISDSLKGLKNKDGLKSLGELFNTPGEAIGSGFKSFFTKKQKKEEIEPAQLASDASGQINLFGEGELIEQKQKSIRLSIKQRAENIKLAASSAKTIAVSKMMAGAEKAKAVALKTGALAAKIGATAMKTLASASIWMFGITGIIKLIEGFSTALGINTEALEDNINKNQEKSTALSSLGEEYEEIAGKLNKTTEEQKRLKEITGEIYEQDKKLGSQLKINGEAYRDNISLIKDTIKETDKQIAQNKIQLAQTKSSGINTAIASFGDTWNKVFNPEQLAATIGEAKSLVYELSSGIQTESKLSSSQENIYSVLATKFIEETAKKATDSADILGVMDRFESHLRNIAENTKNMTEKDIKDYSDVQSIINDEQSSIIQSLSALKGTDLIGTDAGNALYNQIAKEIEVLDNFIKSNPYITDPDQFSSSVKSLPRELLTQLTTAPEELTTDELDQFNKESIKFVQQQGENLAKAMKDSSFSFGDFAERLRGSGEYSSMFLDSLIPLPKTLDDLQSSSAKAAETLGRFKEMELSGLLGGDVSQIDIISKILDGTLKKGDYYFDGSGFAINFDSVAQTMKQTTENMLLSASSEINALKTQSSNIINEIAKRGKTPFSMDNINAGYRDALSKISVSDQEANEYINKNPDKLKLFGGKGIVTQAKTAITQSKIEPATEKYVKSLTGALEEYALKELESGVSKGDLIGKNINTNDRNSAETTLKSELLLTEDIVNAAQERFDLNEKTINQNDKVIAQKEKEVDKMRDILNYEANIVDARSEVLTGVSSVGDYYKDLDAMKEAYELASGGNQNLRDVTRLIAQNGILADAISDTSAEYEFSADKIKALAEVEKQQAKKSISLQISILEAELALLQNGTEAEIESGNISREELAKQLYAKEQEKAATQSLVDTNKMNYSTDIDNLESYGQQYKQVLADIQKAKIDLANTSMLTGAGTKINTGKIEVSQEYSSAEQGKSWEDYLSEGGSVDAYLERYKQTYSATTEAGSNRIKEITTNISQLKRIVADIDSQSWQDVFGGGSGGGGGSSTDAFENYIAEFERFYNILRKIEDVESDINKVQTERNILDKTDRFSLDNLKLENQLLEKQLDLYQTLESAQSTYLQELKAQIQSTYGDWAHFAGDIIQINQEKLIGTNEEEKAVVEKFEQMIEEYEGIYNDLAGTTNTIFDIENSRLENILTMYDKYIDKVEMVNEKFQEFIDLTDFGIEMEFGELDKFDLFAEKIDNISNSLLNYQGTLTGASAQANALLKTMMNGDFKDLFSKDKSGTYSFDKNKVGSGKTFTGASGTKYSTEDVIKFANSAVVSMNKLNEIIKESEENVRSMYSELRNMVEERASLISEYFGTASEQMSKFYNIYGKTISDLERNESDYGITADTITARFNAIVTAAKSLEDTVSGLEKKSDIINKKIQENYAQYVKIVDGQLYFNSQEVLNSETLTEAQKAEFLQLQAAFEGIEELLGSANDQLDEYTSAIVTMEKARVDALVSITNQVADALQNADQMEIDNLREKYDTMTQLDEMYYNELTKRIQDVRDARGKDEAQVSLAQQEQRLALLQTDSSGSYSAEIQQLQASINQQKQSIADSSVDEEIAKIAEEQEERQKDRELQIKQLEELMSYRIENGVYWEMSNGIIAQGDAAIQDAILAGQEFFATSQLEQQEFVKQLQAETAVALTKLGDKLDSLNAETPLEQQIKDLITGSGLTVDDTGVVTGLDNMLNEMAEFNGTLEEIFKLLDEALTKDKAGSTSTGVANPNAPSEYKEPVKPTTPPPTAPAKPTSPPPPSLSKGSYVSVKPGTRWYSTSSGRGTSGPARAGRIRYTSSNSYGYNIDGLGWVRKQDIVGYKTGGLASETGLAMLHGTRNNPERILSAKQTKSFDALVAALTKPTTGLGTSIQQSINVQELNVNVEEVATNDQVNNMITQVKKEITQVGNRKSFSIGGKL